MNDPLQSLRQEAEGFAAELLTQGLGRPTNEAAWREVLARLSQRGWLGQGIGDLAQAGAVLEGLARGGADVGVPLTLTVHYLVALRGLRRQAPQALEIAFKKPGLCCMAASEPGVGAHPKKIQTVATQAETGWQITGEKVFTTGGPLAAVLLVLAVCGESGGRRELGLFVVPADSPGVRIEAMSAHPGLEAAPHAKIYLETVPAPADALLDDRTPDGNGWDRFAKPFRQWEDALLQSWLAGGIAFQSEMLAASLSPVEDRALGALLGRLLAAARALATLARDSVQSLLDEEAGADPRDLAARRYGFYEHLIGMEALVGQLSGALLERADRAAFAQLQALLAQHRFAANARAKIVAGLVARK